MNHKKHAVLSAAILQFKKVAEKHCIEIKYPVSTIAAEKYKNNTIPELEEALNQKVLACSRLHIKIALGAKICTAIEQLEQIRKEYE